MNYQWNSLTQEEVLLLLIRAENSFSPPLSQNIPYTLSDYAKKLSEFARFILCVEDNEIVGFTAYYLNQEGGFVYIPQIWVSDDHQRKGIGAKMIAFLIDEIPSFVLSIRLEVRKNNIKAFSFYSKLGYDVVEEKNGKCLMERIIKTKEQED